VRFGIGVDESDDLVLGGDIVVAGNKKNIREIVGSKLDGILLGETAADSTVAPSSSTPKPARE